MGIVLIERVIGVDDRNIKAFCDLACDEERRKLTVGMNDVRLPVHKLLYKAAEKSRLDSGAGIDLSHADRSYIGHAIRFEGMKGLRQGQNADIMPTQHKLSAQIHHRGHNSVNNRRVQICCK